MYDDKPLFINTLAFFELTWVWWMIRVFYSAPSLGPPVPLVWLQFDWIDDCLGGLSWTSALDFVFDSQKDLHNGIRGVNHVALELNRVQCHQKWTLANAAIKFGLCVSISKVSDQVIWHQALQSTADTRTLDNNTMYWFLWQMAQTTTFTYAAIKRPRTALRNQ